MSGAALSRRALLQRTGWTAAGVTVVSGCSLIPVLPSFGAPEPDDGLAWVQLTGEGRVRFLCPRSELGQGAATGLSQVVAEELRVPLEEVDCVYPTTTQISATQMTVGSQSIENFFLPTASAAAALRETMRARAGASTGVPVAEIETVAFGFSLPGGRMLTYRELVAADESTVITPQRALLDAPRFSQQPEARIVGSVQTPVHLDAVVTGTEQYSCDVRLPDMHFGAVARPPYLEATLEGCDRDGAVTVEGVLAVVDGPNDAVGVVAETPMAARRGVSALACRWAALDAEARAHIGTPNDIDAAIAADLLDHTPVDEGSLAGGRAAAARTLDVRYDSPMTAHAAMEPRAGVAHVTESGAVVHTGSQDPWYVQGAVARAIGLSRDAVEVHNHRVGGAFGGRILCQASVEAAWLSQAVGQPVKVQWTREEEFRFNYVGPEFSHRIEAGLTADGEIAFWHHRMVGSPILTTSALVPPHLRWAADLPADPGTWRGTNMPYRSTNRRVDFADVRGGMPTGAWRGLGAAPNTFAVECVMDELAALAEVDPLEFRRRHAENPRLVRVLERVGVLADWPGRRGLGVAAAAYKHATFVAVVARVRREHGRPVVDKLWCAHDCGLVIAPDQVRAQIQGNLVWGVGMALFEAFELEDGIGRTANFDSYRLPRQVDVPDMEIELVGGSAAPTGAGEAAFAPAAAAIVNALASLDGVRTRSLPMLAV